MTGNVVAGSIPGFEQSVINCFNLKVNHAVFVI